MGEVNSAPQSEVAGQRSYQGRFDGRCKFCNSLIEWAEFRDLRGDGWMELPVTPHTFEVHMNVCPVQTDRHPIKTWKNDAAPKLKEDFYREDNARLAADNRHLVERIALQEFEITQLRKRAEEGIDLKSILTASQEPHRDLMKVLTQVAVKFGDVAQSMQSLTRAVKRDVLNTVSGAPPEPSADQIADRVMPFVAVPKAAAPNLPVPTIMQFRAFVMQDIAKGKAVSEIAESYKLEPELVKYWKNNGVGPTPAVARELKAARAKTNGQAAHGREEITIDNVPLKEGRRYSSQTKREALRGILAGELGATQLAKYNVSVGAMSNWIKEAKAAGLKFGYLHRRSHRKLDWPPILREFRASGKTPYQFCKGRDIQIGQLQAAVKRAKKSRPS